jgi:hypothetical protein
MEFMNIIHDFYDNNALDFFTRKDNIIYQAVGRSDRTPQKTAPRKKQRRSPLSTNGHTTVWGTHIGAGPAREVKGWYQQLRDRWVAYKAARQQAKREALQRCWDARHEAVRPLRADAAIDMVLAQDTFLMATQPFTPAV